MLARTKSESDILDLLTGLVIGDKQWRVGFLDTSIALARIGALPNVTSSCVCLSLDPYCFGAGITSPSELENRTRV